MLVIESVNRSAPPLLRMHSFTRTFHFRRGPDPKDILHHACFLGIYATKRLDLVGSAKTDGDSSTRSDCCRCRTTIISDRKYIAAKCQIHMSKICQTTHARPTVEVGGRAGPSKYHAIARTLKTNPVHHSQTFGAAGVLIRYSAFVVVANGCIL